MELNEAFRRIAGQHWRLIACFVLAGLGIGALFHGAGSTYTSSARLVLDTQDPKTRAEAGAIADTGQAIATSPAQVSAAIARTGFVRNPLDVAEHHVLVRPLGTSGVLELSVSDRNARAAAAMANALASEIIRARLHVSSGELQQLLGTIHDQIVDVSRRISDLDVQIASLSARAGGARSTAATNAAKRRDLLAQRRAALEAERVTLLSSNAQRPKPSIISRASLPLHPDPSRWLAVLTLGALLGLVLGAGIAGVIEMIRPTLVGDDALAREFDTRLIGTLPGAPDDVSLANTGWLSECVRLAAESAGVHSVRLLAAAPPVDLRHLATCLTPGRDREVRPTADAPVRRGRNATGVKSAVLEDELAQHVLIDVFDVYKWSPNGGGTGVVIVSPIALRKSELMDIKRFLELSPLPVLGLITYAHTTTKRKTPRPPSVLVAPVKTWWNRGVVAQRTGVVVRERVRR
jgi:hypothetical protein